MFEDVMHQGRMLTEWQKLFHNEFSLGELYRMAKEGADFNCFLLNFNHTVTLD